MTKLVLPAPGSASPLPPQEAAPLGVNAAPIASPYPGLRPFEASEAGFFFGRTAQIVEVRTRLSDHHFVAVVGGSGCGKSSLVRAGILPELQLGGIPGTGSFWVPIVFTPGTDPIGNLARSFSGALEPESSRAAHEARLDRIRYTLRQMDGLSALLSEFRPNLRVEDGPTTLRERANLLVLVDQFEEIFRRENRGKSDVERLVRLIEDCYERRDQRIFMVLTMRSEDLHSCAEFTVLTQALNRASYLVPRLDDSSLDDIIVLPAQRFAARLARSLAQDPNSLSVRFDERVLSLIDGGVREMKGDPDYLPLLQHLLFRLWQHASGEGRWAPSEITLDDMAWAAGDSERDLPLMARSLHCHAERVFTELTPAAATSVAAAMFRLMGHKDDKGNYKRSFTSRAEIAFLSESPGDVVNSVVTHFSRPHPYIRDGELHGVEARDTPVDGDLDVAHEALIRNWQRLRRWIDDETERIQNYGVLIQRLQANERLDDRELKRMEESGLSEISSRWAAKYAEDLRILGDDAGGPPAHGDRSRERQWSMTHTRAMAFLARARRRRRFRRFVPAVGFLLVLLTVGLLGSAMWFNFQKTISEREAGTFRSLAIAGNAPVPDQLRDQPLRQRSVLLQESLIALRNFEGSALVENLGDWHRRVPGLQSRIDPLRVAMLPSLTAIDRSLRTVLFNGVWPIRSELGLEGDRSSLSGASPATCTVSKGKMARVLGSRDGRRLVVVDNRVQWAPQLGAECGGLTPLFGVPPGADIKVDPDLDFVVARVASPALPGLVQRGSSARWQFWALVWHCLNMETTRQCRKWVVRGDEIGTIGDETKDAIGPEDWALERRTKPVTAFASELILTRWTPEAKRVQRTTYRIFRGEPGWPGVEGTPLEPQRVSGNWKRIDSPGADCASETRADSSHARGTAAFASVYHLWANRCVEIRESTKEDEYGWAYTFRTYRTDREGSTSKVSAALKAYATGEVRFTGPKLKAILLDVTGQGDPPGVGEAARSPGDIIPGDRIYVRTMDDQVFHLPSSLQLLKAASCRVINDSRTFIGIPQSYDWSESYRLLSLEGSPLQRFSKEPCPGT